MEILRLQPEQRVSWTESVQGADNSNKSPQLIYTCPCCQKKSELKITDYSKNDFPDTFLKGLFYKRAFDQEYLKIFQYKKTGHEVCFRDFFCGNCYLPVRIIFKSSVQNGPSIKIIGLLEAPIPQCPSEKELIEKLNSVIYLYYTFSSGQGPSLYLWLLSLLLVSPDDRDPWKMAQQYFQEKNKYERIMKNRVDLPKDLDLWLSDGNFSFILALIIRYGKSAEDLLLYAQKVEKLLDKYKIDKNKDNFLLILTSVILNGSSDHLEHRFTLIKDFEKINFSKEALPSFGKLFFSLFLGPSVNAQDLWRRMNKIWRLLQKKELPFSAGQLEILALFISLQGKNVGRNVRRFKKILESFSIGLMERKMTLKHTTNLPGKEHPFRKVAASFLDELSPSFLNKFPTILSMALLSILPWNEEVLAKRSLQVYSYLRSFRKLIGPGLSILISSGIIFRVWEEKNYLEIFLLFIFIALADLEGAEQNGSLFN